MLERWLLPPLGGKCVPNRQSRGYCCCDHSSDINRRLMQETITIVSEVTTEDVFRDLQHDFPDCRVGRAAFGWIAVDLSVDVTVRLKVGRKRVALYARRRAAPGILEALFGGSLLSMHAELELTRELKHEQKRIADWVEVKYGESN